MVIDLQNIKETEDSKDNGSFELKDTAPILIARVGHLKIACTGTGFEMNEKSEVGNQTYPKRTIYTRADFLLDNCRLEKIMETEDDGNSRAIDVVCELHWTI